MQLKFQKKSQLNYPPQYIDTDRRDILPFQKSIHMQIVSCDNYCNVLIIHLLLRQLKCDGKESHAGNTSLNNFLIQF